MSFLADPALLMMTGAAVEEMGPDEDEAAQAKRTTLAVFYAVSLALWFDLPVIRLWTKVFGGTNGRDFMLNSGWVSLGLLRFDPAKKNWRRNLVAAAVFATYPLFFDLGRRMRRRAIESA